MSAHGHAVRLRWTTIMLLVTLPGAACQGWHTEDVAPQAVLTPQQTTPARLTPTHPPPVVPPHPALPGGPVEGARQPGGGRAPPPTPVAPPGGAPAATPG